MEGNVLIRVDGNSKLGLGHLIRSIALAQMLKNYFTIHFVCKFIPTQIESEFQLWGFKLSRIINEGDFISLLNSAQIVVLDGYEFTLAIEQQIKAKGALLVCIDDLHNKQYQADLIINHTPGILAQEYHAQMWTKYALGPKYSLLRPAFLNAKRDLEPPLKAILICFGGADPKNFTKKALEVVTTFKEFKRIVVITGAAYIFHSDLKPIIESDERITLFHALHENQMAEQLLKTLIAVVPASGVLLEAMACRVIPVSGMYIENQRDLYEHYKSENCFIDAKEFSSEHLQIAIRQSLNDSPVILNNLIDGQSGTRILKLVQQLLNEKQLKIRLAIAEDVDVTFKWATDPKVRAYSFTNNSILWEEHEDWFISKLNNAECFYFILELDDKPIGSVRFDIQRGEAVVSYLLDASIHGRGFGVTILTLGIKALLRDVASGSIKKIVGYTMRENEPSIRIFKRLGFSESFANGCLRFEKIQL